MEMLFKVSGRTALPEIPVERILRLRVLHIRFRSSLCETVYQPRLFAIQGIVRRGISTSVKSSDYHRPNDTGALGFDERKKSADLTMQPRGILYGEHDFLLWKFCPQPASHREYRDTPRV